MKNISSFFIAVLLLQLTTLAQQDWFEQTSGTTNSLNSVYFVDSDIGLAVGANIFSGGNVFRSTNGGISWTNKGSNKSLNLFSIHFLNRQEGKIVGTSGSIFTTVDGGERWFKQTNSISKLLRGVHFIDTQKGWIVGNDGTILYTSNSGSIWQSQNSGTSESLYSLYFLNEQLGWAVGGKGTVLKYVKPTSIQDKSKVALPSYFNLYQNYPNPFNPNTTIKYQIPELSFVTIKVYDVLGNEITKLVNEEKPIGSYEVEFYTKDLPSGIYFYRLLAGSLLRLRRWSSYDKSTADKC